MRLLVDRMMMTMMPTDTRRKTSPSGLWQQLETRENRWHQQRDLDRVSKERMTMVPVRMPIWQRKLGKREQHGPALHRPVQLQVQPKGIQFAE